MVWDRSIGFAYPRTVDELASRLHELGRLASAGELHRTQAGAVLARAAESPCVVRALRDHHLRRAAELLPGSPWQRAEALTNLIRLVAVRRAPRWRVNGIPASSDPAEVEVYAAIETGVRVPESAQALWIIITNEVGPET